MAVYNLEIKEEIFKEMMPLNNQIVTVISREVGISVPTLYVWKKQFRYRGCVTPSQSSDRWDAKAKLAAVIPTAALNGAEHSTYCREHDLYVEQLDAWKQAFDAASQNCNSTLLYHAACYNFSVARNQLGLRSRDLKGGR